MKKKYLMMLALAASAVLLLASCGKKPAETGGESSETSSSSAVSSEVQSSAPASSSSESSKESEPPRSAQIIVYDIETETANNFSVEVADDLDQALVDSLNETYGNDEYAIRLNSVTLEDGALTIDFAGDSVPLVGAGSSTESSCLRSIAETFLQNYPEAELVYLTVDGGSYSSGHLEFGEGEPFMDRSMMEKK